MERRDLSGNVLVLIFVLMYLAGAGCTRDYHLRRADAVASGTLLEQAGDVLEKRRENVVYPEAVEQQEALAGQTATPAANERPAPADEEPTTFTLRDVLEIAYDQNRDFISEKESLYLTALELSNARHDFTPQVSAVLSYLFSDGSEAAKSQRSLLGLDVTQRLWTGGRLSLSGDTSFQGTYGEGLADPATFSSSLGVQLSQPLLRGAGSEVALESRIQAERNLIYAIRSFELFRQDFSIEVARRFYDIFGQIQSLENQHRNMESVIFARRKAEAFFDVGRTNELDVLRARRSELSSQISLIAAEEALRVELERFKVFLGLDPIEQIQIEASEFSAIPVSYNRGSAVDVALANRLDVINRREQLEDQERALRIAENNLLPDLNLDLGYNRASQPEAGFTSQSLDNESYSVGVSMELPFDRVRERNSLRSSQIALDRAYRSYQEFEDNLIVQVTSALRELTRRWKSLELLRILIKDQEKNERIAQIRVNRGEIDNRDLLEVQQELLEARNNLIRENIDYEITRLRLLRALGILFIDEKGMWAQ